MRDTVSTLNCEGHGESMKSPVVVIVLVLICLGASPDVAVYPGATVDEQVSKSVRKGNPENVAYNSTDAFETVDDFYQKAGSEDVPHSRNISTDMKYVVLRFPGKKYQVALSWNVNDKRHGTVIQFLQRS
jgi:hypothetical protein